MKSFSPYCALAALLFAVGCNPSSDSSSGASSDSQNVSSGRSASADTQSSSTTTAAGSTNDTSKLPDNTGRNVRDRSDATLTPGDQGETQADVELTRRIRRALTSNDQLSTDAKNIKVITQNGKVTLRGPVKTEEERRTIASVAQQQAGTAAIDNQLEVKATNQ
jgi:hyperosmotically inducible periplasmic protein